MAVYKDTLISTIVDSPVVLEELQYLVYKDTLISTIVDLRIEIYQYYVYKDTLISTIVDPGNKKGVATSIKTL